jgi:hypothetical protein
LPQPYISEGRSLTGFVKHGAAVLRDRSHCKFRSFYRFTSRSHGWRKGKLLDCVIYGIQLTLDQACLRGLPRSMGLQNGFEKGTEGCCPSVPLIAGLRYSLQPLV